MRHLPQRHLQGCAVLVLATVVALVLPAGPARGYVLLGPDWTHEAAPMGEDFFVCTTSFPAGALASTKDGAAIWDYGGFVFTFGADSCPAGNNYSVFDGNNQFDYGPGLPNGVLAETSYWTSSGQIIECDIRMSSSYSWHTGAGAPPGNALDWHTVAGHEFGHCLGLDHSSDRNALMYASLSGGSTKRTLTADDVDGRNAIYGVLCGNGTVDGNEECDDGNDVETDGCLSACVTCGNGLVTAPESCDDGNTIDGDGCSASCTVECLAAPSGSCEAGFAKGKLLLKEVAGKEKLIVQWKKGPDLDGDAFGDPASPGGSAYALCLYDDSNTLVGDYVVARAGDVCDGKPCWKTLGVPPFHRGYAYKDSATASDGINKITLKGPGAATIKIVGKNNVAKGLDSLPTGTAATLIGSTSAVAELHVVDQGSCFSIELDVVKKSDAENFLATK